MSNFYRQIKAQNLLFLYRNKAHHFQFNVENLKQLLISSDVFLIYLVGMFSILLRTLL